MAAKSLGAIPSSELLGSGAMIHPITCTARNLLLAISPTPLRDLWKVSGTLPHMRDGSFLATLPGMVNVIRPRMTAARHHPGTEMPRDGITCPWEGYATPRPPDTHTQGSAGRAWPSWDSKPQARGEYALTLATLQGSAEDDKGLVFPAGRRPRSGKAPHADQGKHAQGSLPPRHTRWDTCSYACTQGSTCHVLLGRLSPAG